MGMITLPDRAASWVNRVLYILGVANGTVAMGMLLAYFGWPLPPEWTEWWPAATHTLIAMFILQQALRLFTAESMGRHVRQHWGQMLVTLLAVVELFSFSYILDVIPFGAQVESGTYTLVYLAVIQVTVLWTLVLQAMRHNSLVSRLVLSPGLLLISSFLVMVLGGALLLKMPNCVHPGQSFTWLDSIFTSTSAVCVTGLTVVDTASCFTQRGQFMIMLLIQAGGLGIMTITYFMASFVAGGISIRDRVFLGDMMNEDRLGEIASSLKWIVITTFSIEVIGAVGIYQSLDGVSGCDGAGRLFSAAFHSVSAFCNAGFSLFPGNLADPLVHGRIPLQLMVCCLVILGGTGPLVLRDCQERLVNRVRRWFDHTVPIVRLSFRSRFVLWTTALLLAVGTVALYLSEYSVQEGHPDNGGRLATAFFNAVSPRTAGFNTVDMAALAPATVWIIIVLMVIGGSPGGTAGGLRTTTFALAVLNIGRVLRGQEDLVVFRRSIARDDLARALGILSLGVAWIFLNFIVLVALEPGLDPQRLLFEVASATGTVGLTINTTTALGEAGRILIIINMFVGRIGLMTFFCTLVYSRKSASYLAYPGERVTLT